MSKNKFYQLIHPGGPGGVVASKNGLKRCKQAAKARATEGYAAVFFPKITGIGPAAIWSHDLPEKLANSPEAARVKFMDGIKQGEKWETYADAGWRIRKVRITDLGDA